MTGANAFLLSQHARTNVLRRVVAGTHGLVTCTVVSLEHSSCRLPQLLDDVHAGLEPTWKPMV
jgi:hypothetical protein